MKRPRAVCYGFIEGGQGVSYKRRRDAVAAAKLRGTPEEKVLGFIPAHAYAMWVNRSKP